MRSTATLLALFTLLATPAAGCMGGAQCTEIGCESSLEISYGSIVVNEPYELTINIAAETISVVCLSNDPDAEPLPAWLECSPDGFEIVGERAETTTVSVTVLPLSSDEAVIPSVLVPTTVVEELAPNGPDCEPICYRRTGNVPDAGPP